MTKQKGATPLERIAEAARLHVEDGASVSILRETVHEIMASLGTGDRVELLAAIRAYRSVIEVAANLVHEDDVRLRHG